MTVITSIDEIENKYRAYEWEEMDKEIDRAWYDQEEDGGVVSKFDEYAERKEYEHMLEKKK